MLSRLDLEPIFPAMQKIVQAALFIHCLFFSIAPTFGQKKAEFAGEVEATDGRRAYAEFTYFEGKDAKVLDGKYKLIISKIDTARQLRLDEEVWQGNYKENLRDGKWLFRHLEHDLKIKGIESYNVKFDLQTIERQMVGEFDKGLSVGDWRYKADLLLNGQRERNLSGSDIKFSDGKVKQLAFESKVDTLAFSLRGQVDEGGFLDSLWTFNYMFDSVNIREVRQYQHGFLTFLTKIRQESSDTLLALYFDDVRSKLELLEENDDAPRIAKSSRHFPLQFDHGYPKNFPAYSAQEHANNLLDNVLTRLVDLDTALKKQDNWVFASARFEYTPTEREKATLNLIAYHFDSLQAHMRLFEQNRVLKVNQQLSDSIAWISSFVEQYKVRLNEMQPYVEAMERSSFRYNNQVIYAEAFSPFLPSSEVIGYHYGADKKDIEITYQEAYEGTMRSLEARLRGDLHLIADLHHYADRKLGEVNKSEQLDQMDEMIIRSKESVDSIFSAASLQNNRATSILSQLKSNFLESAYYGYLSAYNKENDFEERLNNGYSILNMLEVCARLPAQIENIFKMRDEVEEAFTVVKFDPYTFNYDFKTKRKRRLYEAGAEELFEYLVGQLTLETDYQNVKQRISIISKLHQRLLELLEEENTDKLERKLRNENNPENIKALLSL